MTSKALATIVAKEIPQIKFILPLIRAKKIPMIEFTCTWCRVECEADANAFQQQNTMPPSWIVECGYCGLNVRCFPNVLLAKEAASASKFEAIIELIGRI